MTVLINTISEIKHDNLEIALHYYEDTLKLCDVEPTGIDSLDELCYVLNNLNVYDCGHSFEIKEEEENTDEC